MRSCQEYCDVVGTSASTWDCYQEISIVMTAIQEKPRLLCEFGKTLLLLHLGIASKLAVGLAIAARLVTAPRHWLGAWPKALDGR